MPMTTVSLLDNPDPKAPTEGTDSKTFLNGYSGHDPHGEGVNKPTKSNTIVITSRPKPTQQQHFSTPNKGGKK